MISPDIIRSVIKALCAAVEINFVRAEQDGDRPTGIFLSYKILTQTPEPQSKDIEEYVTDGDGVNKVTKKKSFVSVSFSLNAPAKSYEEAYSAAVACIAWLESEEGLKFCSDAGVYPDYSGRPIRDISAILETGYECRLGFDVKFSGIETTVASVDGVDTGATLNLITI